MFGSYCAGARMPLARFGWFTTRRSYADHLLSTAEPMHNFTIQEVTLHFRLGMYVNEGYFLVAHVFNCCARSRIFLMQGL